jgi:hypothetical protein
MDGRCLSCDLNEQTETLPPPERLYLDDYWRVAHAWSSLPDGSSSSCDDMPSPSRN